MPDTLLRLISGRYTYEFDEESGTEYFHGNCCSKGDYTIQVPAECCSANFKNLTQTPPMNYLLKNGFEYSDENGVETFWTENDDVLYSVKIQGPVL